MICYDSCSCLTYGFALNQWTVSVTLGEPSYGGGIQIEYGKTLDHVVPVDEFTSIAVSPVIEQVDCPPINREFARREGCFAGCPPMKQD